MFHSCAPRIASANSDPRDYALWPFNKRQLLDDLWALSLCHLPELPQYDQLVSQKAALSGRNLEPWRSLLAVAYFLQEKGIDGLFERVNQLSVSYQRERADLESIRWHTMKGRRFTKMAYEQYFSHQALQENISKITPAVLEKIPLAICQHGVDPGIDDGQKIRTDSTAIETNIHHPTNASLL